MRARSMTEKWVVSSGSDASGVTTSLPSSTLLEALSVLIDCVDSRVLLRGELLNRYADEIGVAQLPRSIQVRATHRLDPRRMAGCGEQPFLLQVRKVRECDSTRTRATPPELGGGI